MTPVRARRRSDAPNPTCVPGNSRRSDQHGTTGASEWVARSQGLRDKTPQAARTFTERGVGWMDVDLGFDKERLGGFIRRVQDDPAAGQTVWAATTHWQHGFKSEANIRSHTVR